MEFNIVFDIQKVYRDVLEAMSYPGRIKNVSDISAKLKMNIDCFNVTQLLMYMLLDTDTSFNVISKSEEINDKFSQITYSKKRDIQNANFIFITLDSSADKLCDAIVNSNNGTLEDPQNSATIIVECENINNEPKICFTGCGIKDKNYLNIELKNQWIENRESKNFEFPLGVDMIFVDKNSNIVCIPRTTTIERINNQLWHM